MQIKQIHARWSFLATHKVFVGCSGGVDSVVLLFILKSFCPDLEVIHVNYSLRGKDSDYDEDFVRKLCVSLKVPLHVKKVDTKAVLASSGGNLQEVARTIRYTLFREKLSLHPGSIVALGQHADDQVETFFQHLARKSGVLGMSCMLSQHEGVVRPLLSYSKNEILAFAKKYSLDWREDQSNQTNTYTRNRIRNVILPELYIKIPSLKDSVLKLVDIFQETQRMHEQEARRVIGQFMHGDIWLYADFDSLSEDICLEVIRQYGGGYNVYASLLKMRDSQKGKWVQCGTHKIYKETSGFYFVSTTTLEIKHALKISYLEELPSVFSKDIIYLDATKIEGKLVLRFWKQGDRISPIGMKGSKLVSDILTEAKVTTSDRNTCMVLVDDNSVLWCVGYKISRKAIANSTSEKIVQVEVIKTEV
jgi:tRNA(Ile)-lysidine synthase